ncbi:signal peptidase I [Bacteroidales bacterium OttesenSCG-928-L03]|nr:signal peptidase I [Bacteroidales bacterium OttesenSCG-928-L03]
MKVLKNTLLWLLILVFTLILAISLRVFVFATFTIPTPSMEPAILPGDRIVVNKLIPGPRIIKNFFSIQGNEKPDILRLRGVRKVKRNDVLVFNYPRKNRKFDIDLNTYYAKRCVALPGDIFSIEEGIYKIQGVSDTLGNYPAQKKFYERPEEKIKPGVFHCFPKKSGYNWTVKEFGPLYVPARGDQLSIDSLNIALYKDQITYETGLSVKVSQGKVLLGERIIDQYTFEKNYYFMAGDFVFDSQDSRYWGLLPEDHIVGKAVLVYKSIDPKSEKRRWNRFLKKVK